MAITIEAETYQAIIFFGICIWLIYKYPRMMRLQAIMMIMAMPVAIMEFTDLTADDNGIYIILGLFVIFEYLALMHIIQNYNDNRSKK